MVNIYRTVFRFYDKWNIQLFVMFSFCLQSILLLFTPFRKRTRSGIIIFPIWVAYVLADWAAGFAIGLISNHQDCSPKPHDDHDDILAFWATFLLLHLGGPDNASAFALEDNTFWPRQLIGLIGQLLSTVIVFSQRLPRKKLWFSTLCILVAGTIKYAERIRALYRANLGKYQKALVEREKPSVSHDLPADGTRRLSEVLVVEKAYEFLQIFKYLIADIIPKDDKLKESKSFFSGMDSTDALRTLEVQLSLIYEIFYTKTFVVYSKWGRFFRFIYWCAVVSALLIFSSIDKNGFRNVDVQISYLLLFGTFGLDTIAFFMVAISDPAVVYINKSSKDVGWRGSLCRCLLFLLEYFFTLKRIKRISDVSKFGCFDWVIKLLFRFFFWIRGILFWRWSGSLHTYNFIDYCLKERFPQGWLKRILTKIDFLKGIYDGIRHVSKKPVEETLWKFIFTQLDKEAKGKTSPGFSSLNDTSGKLKYHDDDYYRTLLLWHIATDLCYENNEFDNYCVFRTTSKILSDYILYLLVKQPTFMSAFSGVTTLRFWFTCKHAQDIFRDHFSKVNGQMNERAEARESFFLNYCTIREKRGGYSVLPEAIELAMTLEKELDPYKRWKIISTIWVGLLSYTASHCRAEMHIAQLSKGGELITFLWLLKAHLGLRDDLKLFEDITALERLNY